MAKKGTTLGEGPSNDIATAYASLKNEIKKFYQRKWQEDWEKYTEARQTKIWFPKPDPKKSKELLKMKRKKLSKMIQFLSGHNKLKYHMNLQDGINDPGSCRLCMEDEESSYHIIGECPAMEQIRFEIFHRNILGEKPIWEIPQVEKFLRISQVGNMLEGEEP